MLRAPGSLTSGEMDAVRLVGPRVPTTNRGRCGSCAVTSSHWVLAMVADATFISYASADMS